MTTTRTYKCNLCRKEIADETGFGVLFVTDFAGRINLTQVKDAENHICAACLDALRIDHA